MLRKASNFPVSARNSAEQRLGRAGRWTHIGVDE